MESPQFSPFITDKKIISTDSLDVIESEVCDEETLLVFDCDDVIIHRTDAVFAPVNKDVHQQMWDYLRNKVEAEKFEELCLSVRKQASVELLDDSWPALISKLQKKNVKIILHTAHRTGSFCDEVYVEDLRISELLKFGMDFSKNWGNVEYIIFENLATKLENNGVVVYPMFKHGIIFCCHLDKGKVLEEFLERIDCKFKKIVFVDDQLRNLSSVQNVISDGQNYVGIEYGKIRKIPALRIDFEEMQNRLDQFIQTGHWISDEEFYS